jgi:tripartite ATP-independent transporter DctP family solute receptor
MEEFGRELEELSDGFITVKIFPNAQLGTERELIELIQIGALSMTKVSSLSLEGFSEDMKVFSLPYIFDDDDHRWRVLEGDVGQEVLASLSPKLLKGLAYYDAGSRSFYMRDVQVHTPDDIRGKTVRVLPSRALVQTIEAFGGAAAPIAFGELYTAIQQGVVDGAENNPPSYLLARHFEVAKFYTLDEHIAAPDVVVISQRIWDDLAPQEQSWVRTAMDNSVAFQRELWTQSTQEALAELEASGVTVIVPDKAPFRAAVADLKRAFDGDRIGELLKRIESDSQQNKDGA